MAITPKSGIRILRRQIAGMEPSWAKMFDPPTNSPTLPERLAPTNPVPELMGEALGLGPPGTPSTVEMSLLNSLSLLTWDGAKELEFMAFRDDNFSNEAYPGPTLRVPRGVIFHCNTKGKGPPPHTIHWHGIEPTPMNDGVGHCSMEIGEYTYQWQPNFVGSYFYHCHRNTVQHFEFGLFGKLIIEPPNAFSTDPIMEGGEPRDPMGYPRRTSANLADFPRFPGFVAGDSVFGVAGPGDVGVGDPHAFTIPYDVEALWVCDDRDSVWSDLAKDARAFYPGGPNTGDGPLEVEPQQPGKDDQFPKGFFHDFNPDYWYVTGVPVQAHRKGTGLVDPTAAPPVGGSGGVNLGPEGLIPPTLNSGVSGMQIAVNARLNQTILVRLLDAAYGPIHVRFPIDAVIIARDGRALGVPPFERYSRAFLLPAGSPIHLTTAQRVEAIFRSSTPVSDFATVDFIDPRGENVLSHEDRRQVTARIPFNIS